MHSVIIFLLVCVPFIGAQEAYGISYIAQQMDQYCRIRGGQGGDQAPPPHGPPRVGKAGPPGKPGESGPPGSIDYSRIEEIVERKIEEMLNRVPCKDVTRTEAKIWNGTGGVFDIYHLGAKMEVYCDVTTDGGGWTVFQRRMDGSENFDRTWVEYVNGFGKIDGEFWLGLEKLHRLTSLGSFELRVDLGDWEGNTAYALYSDFSISDATTKYRLNILGYSGTAGDSLKYHHANMMFSTSDRDNDKSSGNCATVHGGGWWYNNCDYSDLNGRYKVGGTYSGVNDGVEWHYWKNTDLYSMKFAEMKIRAKVP